MKGISVLIGLVLGVIILIVLSALFFKVSFNVWNQIVETLGVVQYSSIERAMICYYYLCSGGCSNPDFNSFCGPEKIGRDVYEEICSLPSALGVGSSQCEDAVFQFPLKIELKKDEEISVERLKRKIDSTHVIIVTPNTKGEINWAEYSKYLLLPLIPVFLFEDIFKLLTETSTTFFIDDTFLTDVDRMNYAIGKEILSGVVKYAKIKQGSYYISGYKNFILVDKFTHYVSLKDNGNVELNMTNNQIVRVSIEDEKTDDLRDYNYLLKLTDESYGNILKFKIHFVFWNEDKCRGVCTETKEINCNDENCENVKKESLQFETKSGIITLEIDKVHTTCSYSSDGEGLIEEMCWVNRIDFNIKYNKLKEEETQ